MASQETNLKSLYSELQRLGEVEEYEKALTTCNKILSLAPTETKALHCKVVCLIELGKLDQALNTIRADSTLLGSLTFEKAYCEYRLNRTQEAKATLEHVKDTDLVCLELKAQVLYRLEEFSECLSVYKHLIKNCDESLMTDRLVNQSAVIAAMAMWLQQPTKDVKAIQENSNPNQCVNSSSYDLAFGNYESALNKLKLAESLCQQVEDEEEDPTDYHYIWAQMGYIYQKMGQVQAAREMYNKVLRSPDVSVMAVAGNNVVALNKEQNLFDSKKKMRSATGGAVLHKLTNWQKETIAVNQCLLHHIANQGDQCRTMAHNQLSTYPGNELPRIILAAQLVKDKETDRALDTLKAAPAPVGLQTTLTLAQVLLSLGKTLEACQVLEGQAGYSRLGVVSTLVGLYQALGDIESAGTVYSQALKACKAGSDTLQLVTEACASFHLIHGQPKIAATVLENLHKMKPNDAKVLAQLISAYGKFNPEKAQQLSRKLPPARHLTGDIDAEALEIAAFSLTPKYIKKKTEPMPTTPSSVDDQALQHRRRRKKKKNKAPKTTDGTIDPERWLPLKERSYYRGRRRKNAKDIGKGTQGAVHEERENPSPSASSSATAAAQRQSKSQPKNKKKKKGGKH